MSKSFEVKKSNWNFKRVRFLANALSTDKVAYGYRTHIKVDESGMACATNGHQLNFCDLPFESGYYKVLNNTKAKVVLERVLDIDSNEVSYPNVTDFLARPDVAGFDSDFTVDEMSSTYTKIVRAMTKTTINFYFIESLCETIDEIMTVLIPEPESRFNNSDGENEKQTCQPVHCVNNEFHSVIMPKIV